VTNDDLTPDVRDQDLPDGGLPDGGLQWQPPSNADLPERLRVHTLARALGTTSKRVLDALAEIDGRARSAQSSVDQDEALRVRELLGADSGAEQADSRMIPADSRMIIVESAATSSAAAEIPAYMPLFVAPQPVVVNVDSRIGPDARTGGTGSDLDGSDDDEDDDDEDGDGAADDDGTADRPANRRRRRGRRGRGRGRGDSGADGEDEGAERSAGANDETTADQDESDTESDAGDEESATGEGATRRRRRRRRRKSGSGDDAESGSDDPPNTVVHERAPRSKADRESGEIQGISGSTRLEAKRQRRRDGRDAGRRRPPILSEAEFLARREAVDRLMVVRDKVRTEAPHEGSRYTQIAVLEDGIVVEHFVTSAASASMVGNIYLGIVQNVLPSMEAAFVDIGRGRNGVLYAGEVNWEAAGLGGASRKIEQALKPGDYIVVQVSKDPVGHKGARLTTQLSLAGRYLVYVPGASSTGISRKLPDTERQRLKEILREVVPADAGVIIRTASEGVKEEDIRGDVTRLQDRWVGIAEQAEQLKAKAAGAAMALYEEPDVLVKVIRDLFNEDFAGLVVSGDSAWETITEYVNSVAPELVPKVTKYEPAGGPDGPDVFAVYRIQEQLAKAIDRKVWLPSGGTLVIDRTEAMTVVDVNTGKFTGTGGNLEQTVTKNNLEAAEEVVRQLRLRDIGGIVVIDFIDMVLESNRDLVLRRLTEALARDRTRHQVSEVTSLGLVQLTRKRLGTGLIEAFSTNCPDCNGRGILLHADPVDNAAMGASRSETGTPRRSRRGRKGRTDEPAVARVPAHTPGEHPMFKAMAATTGRDAEDEESDVVTDVDEDVVDENVVELDPIDDDAIDDDDGLDDDDDDDDDGDDDDDDDDDDDEGFGDGVVEVDAPPGRSRRRAAARPAGPPAT